MSYRIWESHFNMYVLVTGFERVPVPESAVYILTDLYIIIAIMMENVRLLYYEQRITQLTFKGTPGVKRHKTS